MLFFTLVPFQEVILAFSLGLGTFLLLYLAWLGYPKNNESEPIAQEGQEALEDSKTRGNPIPPFLVLVYIGVPLWILVYLIFVGLQMKAIG